MLAGVAEKVVVEGVQGERADKEIERGVTTVPEIKESNEETSK